MSYFKFSIHARTNDHVHFLLVCEQSVIEKIYAVFILLSIFSVSNVNAQTNNQWSLPAPQFQCGAGEAALLCADTLNNLTFNKLNITWSLDGFAFSRIGTNTLRVDDA